MPERLALFDVDRTLSKRAVSLEFIRAQVVAGVAKSTDELNVAIDTMEQSLEGGSYEDPLNNLLAQHARSLEGVPESEGRAHAREFFNRPGLWLPYALPTVRALQKHYGYTAYLSSAGGHFWIQEVVKAFGANGSFHTIYETEEKVAKKPIFTGEIIVNLATSGKKAQAALMALDMCPREGSVMMGDSVADISAMCLVDGPFCVNPSAELRQIAAELEWPIIPQEQLNISEMPAIVSTWLRNHLKKMA